jgi:predicted nucleic acid-binding protein
MVGRDVAVAAARNFRTLRAKGITVRRTIGLLIGAFCIERGHALLRNDRDFDPMADHLGLQVV